MTTREPLPTLALRAEVVVVLRQPTERTELYRGVITAQTPSLWIVLRDRSSQLVHFSKTDGQRMPRHLGPVYAEPIPQEISR